MTRPPSWGPPGAAAGLDDLEQAGADRPTTSVVALCRCQTGMALMPARGDRRLRLRGVFDLAPAHRLAVSSEVDTSGQSDVAYRRGHRTTAGGAEASSRGGPGAHSGARARTRAAARPRLGATQGHGLRLLPCLESSGLRNTSSTAKQPLASALNRPLLLPPTVLSESARISRATSGRQTRRDVREQVVLDLVALVTAHHVEARLPLVL